MHLEESVQTIDPPTSQILAPLPSCGIATAGVPLLGTQGGGLAVFEYALDAVSAGWVDIVLTNGRAGAPECRECVELNVPIASEGCHVTGGIISRREKSRCEVRMAGAARVRYPVCVEERDGATGIAIEHPDPEALVRRVLADAVHFKKGISVYFAHLTPYFSRLSMHPARDDVRLDGDFVASYRFRIEEHGRAIHRLWSRADEVRSPEALLTVETLRELREAIAMEFRFDLMQRCFKAPAAAVYLESIRHLEQELYVNYNTLVLLALELSGGQIED